MHFPSYFEKKKPKHLVKLAANMGFDALKHPLLTIKSMILRLMFVRISNGFCLQYRTNLKHKILY